MKLAVFHMLPSGGGCRVVSQLLPELANRFELTLHIPEGAHRIAIPDSVRIRNYRFRGSRQLAGFRRMAAPLTLPLRLLEFGKVCREVAEEVNSDADAILVHNTFVIAAPQLLQYVEIPSVYYCFEYPRHIYEPDLILRTGSRLRELLLAPLCSMERRTDRTSAGCAGRIISLSTYMRKQIHEIYSIESEVVWPGVDTDFYSPGVYDGDLAGKGFVLSVGALWPYKGHETALEAVAAISTEKRPRMVVIADREYPGYGRSLRNLSEASGVDLEILRGIPDTGVRNLYRGAAAVLCCQQREPYGMVPLEAMACGCPVIAVAEGGFPDNVSDGTTGILVKRDASSVSCALNTVLDDDDLRQRLSANGIRFVREERKPGDAADRVASIIENPV